MSDDDKRESLKKISKEIVQKSEKRKRKRNRKNKRI